MIILAKASEQLESELDVAAQRKTR